MRRLYWYRVFWFNPRNGLSRIQSFPTIEEANDFADFVMSFAVNVAIQQLRTTSDSGY